jgi:hypothetical protein
MYRRVRKGLATAMPNILFVVGKLMMMIDPRTTALFETLVHFTIKHTFRQSRIHF